ncbi:MAG: hypothetical protein EP332_02215 [Bacteroidetes bacterium]|nr:MAG: hypothetical protein EP332_02215 [Bacteroidota bacterium]
MKSLLITCCLLAGLVVMLSFSPSEDIQDRYGNFYIKLVDQQGEVKTKNIRTLGQLEWQDSIQSVYFMCADSTLEIEGMLVLAPKVGEAIMFGFKSTAELSAHFRTNQKSGFGYVQGDRIILDNLRKVNDTVSINPIYFTIGY